MSQRMNLWSRFSESLPDAGTTQNEAPVMFKPTFRTPKRQNVQSKSTQKRNNSTQNPHNLTEAQTNPSVKEAPSGEVEKKTSPLDPNARVDEPIDTLEVDMRRKPYRRVAEKKARRRAMSVSVSAEEERILRQHVADMNRSFSEWSRSVMFRAIGRKVPSRGRGREDQ